MDEARERLLAAVASSTPEVSFTLLQRFVLEAIDTTRLSTTFLLAPGSRILDNTSLRDLSRVLRYVKDSRPKRLVLAEFADARSGFAQSLALSASSARAVSDQPQSADSDGQLKGLAVEILGFREFGPVACDEAFDGRATNRRVEI